MLILKIIIVALLGTVCAIILKPLKPELSIMIVIATGLIILFQVLDYFILKSGTPSPMQSI